jgi:hypothetical protein
MDVDLSTQMSKDNNGWVFEYSDVERGIMVGDLSTQNLMDMNPGKT